MKKTDFLRTISLQLKRSFKEEKLGSRVQLAEGIFATCLQYLDDPSWRIVYYFNAQSVKVRSLEEMDKKTQILLLRGTIVIGCVQSFNDPTISFVYKDNDVSKGFDVSPTIEEAKKLLLSVDGSEVDWFQVPLTIGTSWH
ncbi:MAG: hypothetical protein EOM19_02255 [Candidatus Moranbacteria bacterium]|nr:hypothetical protein [Candidatus Moranbacteria bacterium]